MNQLICFMLQSCASPCNCVLQQHPPPSWETPEITFRLCFQQFLYACCYFLTFAVCEEVFAESVSCNSAFNQLPVQIFQDSAQVVMCNLLYFIQDLLIALFRNNFFPWDSPVRSHLQTVFQKYTEDSAPRPSRSPLQKEAQWHCRH